jgi:putative addiction module component (TIGR02574 family)
MMSMSGDDGDLGLDRPRARDGRQRLRLDTLALESVRGSAYSLLMAFTLEQLAEEAMKLPSASRAVLADRIVESLDLAEPDEIQRLWAAEALRRRDEVRSGQIKPIPGEEVLAEVRRLVGR